MHASPRLSRHQVRVFQRDGWYAAVNGRWHTVGMAAFLVLAIAHLVEHVSQGIQYWLLGWTPSMAQGAMGLLMPHLTASEWLHWSYNGGMLAGLILLEAGIVGRARKWWLAALALQGWHFVEHCLLLSQPLIGWRLGGAGVPTSLAQLVIDIGRIELHMLYNWLVFAPLVLGMVYHWCPPAGESVVTPCRCAVRRLFRRSVSYRRALREHRIRAVRHTVMPGAGSARPARSGPPASR